MREAVSSRRRGSMASEKCGMPAKPLRAVPQGAFRQCEWGRAACRPQCKPMHAGHAGVTGRSDTSPARKLPRLPISLPRHAAHGTPHPLPSRRAHGAPVADLNTRRPRAETARPPPPTPPERPPVSESPTWGIAPCVRLPVQAQHARHLRRISIPTPAPAGRQQRENAEVAA